MSFFEPPPPPPEPRERPPRRPWMGPPENELGESVPTRLVLVRRDDLAIALVDLVAYSCGVGGRVALRRKDPFPGRSVMHPMHPMLRHGLAGTSELPPELLRFGVEFADGRRATTIGRPGGAGEAPEIVLMQRGGGGGGGSYEFGFWLWPLPPAGPVTFAVEWPAEGIELTTAQVDAAPLIEASTRSQRLWDDDGRGRGGTWSSSWQTLQLAPKPPPAPGSGDA